MSKHTPGPWLFEDFGPPVEIRTDDSEHYDGKRICLVCDDYTDYSDDDNCEELEATVRLIAAAPDLLAALARMAALIELLHQCVPWGKTFLTANAIRELNEAPGQAAAAIAKTKGGAA